MNITKQYILICIFFLFGGILFCGFYNQWIIIQLPTFTTKKNDASLINKKKVTLHFYHKDKWKTETQEQLWTDTVSKNLVQVINSWLALLDEERIIPKKVSLESALISQASTAYISCDHTFFSKEDSIFKKWMLIESLLKTIRENGIPIQDVQFLVHHQPLQDPHLDFSQPWQTIGFIRN